MFENGSAATAGGAASTLMPARFFDLVDEVIGETGRDPFGETQRRIVEVRDDDAVLQILAGPGSGKTEVLVWRVHYELFVRGAEAGRLMVTTFTRKAAQELSVRMVERSDALLRIAREQGELIADPHVHDLRIGTIHSLCDSLLAEFDELHLEEGTTVIDEVETRIRFARVRGYLFTDDGDRVLHELLDVDELTSLFRPPWLENRMTTLDQVDLALSILNQHIETWIPRCADDDTPNGVEVVHGIDGLTDDLAWIQERWEDYLDDHHVLDFATLQKRFLERQPTLVGELDHVFVDELQDTNPIQYAIHLGWVRHGNVRLTGVGDDDQALYRWRGSDIACFTNLEDDCAKLPIAYRKEVLEQNHRSTRTIVEFAQAFREATVLGQDSLEKIVQAPKKAKTGKPVRLLQADWADICAHVAGEVDRLGAGRLIAPEDEPAPSVAFLMASTSEVESRASMRPALELRRALEDRGLRVYNPRNKTAGRPGSPVHDLLALVSYLIDPVTMAPAGKNGRMIEVWASDPDRSPFAETAPPKFRISQAHASIQKRYIKATGRIGAPAPEVAPLLDYIDAIRDRLIDERQNGGTVRLTVGGLVARVLRMEPFRSCGYTVRLFRQALFTQLLEANVAAMRQTAQALDYPMAPELAADARIEWPPAYWNLLNIFGLLVEAGGIDDLEVEAFEDSAVALLTFHQAKGLEFDHVYVALTGKEVDPASALATELFSGNAPSYSITTGQPSTRNRRINRLARADREREVYVALTRAKRALTVIQAPRDPRWAMNLNAGLVTLFDDAPVNRRGEITIREWRL